MKKRLSRRQRRQLLIDRAVKESRLAYQFAPGSYTYHAMAAILALADSFKQLEEKKKKRGPTVTSQGLALNQSPIGTTCDGYPDAK